LSNYSENNKKLAQNTLYLYLRSVLLIVISLYTTRLTLQALGVDDFGVFNVVGGVVAILSTINGAMSGAASRFIAYELGVDRVKRRLNETYSTIFFIHIVLAAIIFLFGETIGLWFVKEKLVIPAGREEATMICYQCSLIISLLTIISVPYNALIVGYEKMKIFAYITTAEGMLRLLVAVLLFYGNFDRLVFYSFLMVFVQIVILLTYKLYCKQNFREVSLTLKYDSVLIKKIASFAGWTFNGQLAVMGYTQGVNILMNIFFGPVVNAARGISYQVQSASRILVNNFQIAIRPQMIKTWAEGDVQYMHKLVVYSSKYSFFLTALTVFPLLCTVSPILNIWLGNVPEHTVEFVKIILYSMFVDSFCHGMIVSVHATGNIKRFQIMEGGLLLSIVPLSYIFLKYFDCSAEQVMWVYVYVQVLTQLVRMYIALPQIQMKWNYYIRNVFPRTILVFIMLLIPCLEFSLPTDAGLLWISGALLTSFVFSFFVIICIGLNNGERNLVFSYIKRRLKL